jgi:hypothetical protein
LEEDRNLPPTRTKFLQSYAVMNLPEPSGRGSQSKFSGSAHYADVNQPTSESKGLVIQSFCTLCSYRRIVYQVAFPQRELLISSRSLHSLNGVFALAGNSRCSVSGKPPIHLLRCSHAANRICARNARKCACNPLRTMIESLPRSVLDDGDCSAIQ